MSGGCEAAMAKAMAKIDDLTCLCSEQRLLSMGLFVKGCFVKGGFVKGGFVKGCI